MVQAQRCREQRLQADGAVGGLREGVALGVGVLRVVARDDHVDVARRQARTMAVRSSSERSGGRRRKKVR